MGTISILLGIIAFIVFTGAGAIIANVVIEFKTMLAGMMTTIANVSNTTIMIGVISVFAFIGLLICVSMVVQGLTYNRLGKVQKRVRHM